MYNVATGEVVDTASHPFFQQEIACFACAMHGVILARLV